MLDVSLFFFMINIVGILFFNTSSLEEYVKYPTIIRGV